MQSCVTAKGTTDKMAKILCITSGLTGILNASLELINRLQADGHELLYASPKEIGMRVSLHNIAFSQLPEIKTITTPQLPDFKGSFKKLSRWIYKFKNSKRLQAEALKTMDPSAFVSLVKAEAPDLLLIDVELHEYIIKAHASSIPFVILSQWFSLWRRVGLPYLLHDTIPGRGWNGSNLGISISWQKVRFQRWWTFLKKRIYALGTDRRSLLLNFAKKEGFPLDYIKENNWPGPFTYAQLPVLNMTAEEMEFPHEIRPNSYYVGPMIFEDRTDLHGQTNVKSQLDEIIALKETSNSKLIYCSVSTLHQGDLRFLKKLTKAIGSRPDWLLVISGGGLMDNTSFEDLSDNIFVFDYIPQLKILKEADCSINHGGIHTINECIHFGVPMVVYSGKRSDQNGCAARVEYHMLGIMADKDVDGEKDILDKIDKVMNDDVYKNNVASMQLHFEQYKTTHKLENTIRKFLVTENDRKEKISI